VTSFLAIPNYSSLHVLAAGVATFIGFWGVGVALLHLAHLRLPPPWEHVTALLLGIQAVSLTIQLLGMVELSTQPALVAIWWSVAAIGAGVLLMRVRPPKGNLRPVRFGPALLPIAVIGIASATNLMVAVAPSTKIDELYCYMLIPSRIVIDGALRFYREPWVGAIWPHMIYQISAAPSHAIGHPDAPNVVSWGLSATLLWFAWHVIRANGNGVLWTAFSVAGLCVGLYPVVWHVTGGAHAMGDLALAAAVVAFCFRDRLLVWMTSAVYGALVSILSLSAAASKLSLLPVSAILLCCAAWPIMKPASAAVRRKIAFAVIIPWLVFYFPLAAWTWAQSGSPFGPILADVLGTSIYQGGALQEALQSEAEARQPLLLIRNATLGYSPLIWLGAIGVLFFPQVAATTRLILGCLLALQCLLLYRFLPYDVRYLSLHYGLFISFAVAGPPAVRAYLASARFALAACAIVLLPWLAIQLYYAKQFFPVSAGLEKEAFYRRYVAFYDDYRALDRLLPKDAALLIPGFTGSAVYAPRSVFFDPADLPSARPAVLFAHGENVEPGAPLNGYTVTGEIYANPHAVTRTYRTPGRAPVIAPLKVVRLVKNLN
jgi:hypothetical protein